MVAILSLPSVRLQACTCTLLRTLICARELVVFALALILCAPVSPLPLAAFLFLLAGAARAAAQEVQSMQFNILVTTYETIMRDRSKLSKLSWKYIIIDEAQRMKDRCGTQHLLVHCTIGSISGTSPVCVNGSCAIGCASVCRAESFCRWWGCLCVVCGLLQVLRVRVLARVRVCRAVMSCSVGH